MEPRNAGTVRRRLLAHSLGVACALSSLRCALPTERIPWLAPAAKPTATVVHALPTPTAAGPGVAALPGINAPPPTGQPLAYPTGIALAPNGSLLIADRSNHRIVRLDPDGTRTVLAGTGTAGSGGDGGPASQAELRYPTDVALGPGNTLYVADTSNHRIRRIGSDGVIHPVAGVGGAGHTGDGGPGVAARVWFPQGIAVDRNGTLYIADTHNQRLRRVTPDGSISTIAGTGLRYSGGDGGPATEAALNFPAGITVAADGTIYFADWDNNSIRRITPDGIITTIAGTGTAGFAGDGGPAHQAELRLPYGVTIGSDGAILVADSWNGRIRRIAPDTTISTAAGTGEWARPATAARQPPRNSDFRTASPPIRPGCCGLRTPATTVSGALTPMAPSRPPRRKLDRFTTLQSGDGCGRRRAGHWPCG